MFYLLFLLKSFQLISIMKCDKVKVEYFFIILYIISLNNMEAFKPKWINSDYIYYGLNSLRLEDIHIQHHKNDKILYSISK